jgi:hypothetical protein
MNTPYQCKNIFHPSSFFGCPAGNSRCSATIQDCHSMSGLYLQHKIFKPVIIFWGKSRSLSVMLISFPLFPEQGYTVPVSACSILYAGNIRYLHILSKDMEHPHYSHNYQPVTITIHISCTSFKLCNSCDVAHNWHARHHQTIHNYPWTCDTTQISWILKVLVWFDIFCVTDKD